MTAVPIKIRCRNERARVPVYLHEGDAGFDLHSAAETTLVLQPGERGLVPTGLEMEIPPGFEVQVRPRSGWAVREGVTVLNSPGTIDCGYRGEVQVCLVNLSDRPVEIAPGQRIAQGVLAPVREARFEVVLDLTPSSRGSGGFGSTGT
ncbi:MAG: dUTP diphosphatase [Candidatus Riflebacteria bacterium]|nr:dUTP diphosphatase [Candidatus Riflebacteria bacterium]